jgi:purine nucleoside permease
VFQLDEALLQRALSLSTTAALEDSEDMRAYRAHYAQTAARQPPRVTQCDTLSGDTWWAGRLLGDHARHWMRLLTAGKGVYCTTQQEDNAVLEALTRGSQAGLLDLRRVVVLRSASDFDRPYAGQSALQSLETQLALPNAFRIATLNLVHAGMPLIDDIVQDWDAWQQGVPGGKIQP